MAEHDFKPGDLVKVKSGGPLMTYVGDAHMTGLAICEWFEGSKKQSDSFHHAALEKKQKPSVGAFSVGRR